MSLEIISKIIPTLWKLLCTGYDASIQIPLLSLDTKMNLVSGTTTPLRDNLSAWPLLAQIFGSKEEKPGIASWMMNKATDPWNPDLSQTVPPSEEQMQVVNQVFEEFPSTTDDFDAPSFPCVCPTCRDFNVGEFSILQSSNADMLREQIGEDKIFEFLRIIKLEIEKVEEFEEFLRDNPSIKSVHAVEELTRQKFPEITNTFVDGIQFSRERLSKCYVEGDRNLERSARVLVGKWIRLDLPDRKFSTFSKLCPMKVLALFRTIASLPTMWQKFESQSIQKFYIFDAQEIDHVIMSGLLVPVQIALMEQFIRDCPSGRNSTNSASPPMTTNDHSHFTNTPQISTDINLPENDTAQSHHPQPILPMQYEEANLLVTNILGNQLVPRGSGEGIQIQISDQLIPMDTQPNYIFIPVERLDVAANNQEISSSVSDVGQNFHPTSPPGPSTSRRKIQKNSSKLAEFSTASMLSLTVENQEVKLGKISVPMKKWEKAVKAFDVQKYQSGNHADAMRGAGYVLYDTILDEDDKLNCTLTGGAPFKKLEEDKANAIFDGISYIRNSVISGQPIKKLTISEMEMVQKKVFSEHGSQMRLVIRGQQSDNPQTSVPKRPKRK
ncbi:hypothetical protein Fcan01_00038 [Folsomia candida]|uniref:Uncharacterized protein n=1 Tax=Folsomia candida TaxID=158441 RepID=A0A226EUU7_FOLCA|nr:hypothetical protein Fcan01_00038 [Folsomia candida]